MVLFWGNGILWGAKIKLIVMYFAKFSKLKIYVEFSQTN